MVKLRKILFAVFTLLYLIICPALILYSLGIVIKPEIKDIVKTGVIYVDTTPSGATVFVNGKVSREETPTVIDNLIPGTYEIMIKAPHYKTWSTQVSVSAEKATPLNSILLLPDPILSTPISQKPVEKLITADENPFVLAVTGDNTKDLFLHLWDESFRQNLLPEKETTPFFLKSLFNNDPALAQGHIIKYFSTPSSPYMIFLVESNNKFKYYWSDLIFGATKIEDITDLFPTTPTDIQWNESDPRHLFSFENQSVSRIDLATKAIYPKILENVSAFTISGQMIFFINTSRSLVKTSTHSPQENIRLVSTSPLFNDLVYKHFPFSYLSAVSDNIIFLLGEDGSLLSNVKPYLLFDKDVLGFQWNKKAQKLAFWTATKVGVFDFSKGTDPQQDQRVWINYKFIEIKQAHWIQDNYLVVEDASDLLIANTECCGLSDVRKIADIQKNSNTYYSAKIGKIFLIPKETGLFSYINIISQHSLLKAVTKEKAEKNTEL